MPQITKIKPQKNKKRVNIYLDGKFAFGLDLENYLKLNLKVEQELTERQVREILEKGEFAKVRDKLLNYATLRPRSRKEIDRWFYKHKVHESMKGKLVKKLEKLDLLDDEEFAKWWVRQRLSFRPRGRMALRSELIKKGIDRKIIQDVLNQTDIDEVKIAKKLIDKKGYQWKRYEGYEKKQKIGQYLARKGFGWGVIKKVIKE